ncbi:hypothetical protein NBRC116591_23370 [Sessilibacter corallicola]|uniref:Uncharacterized protein n=1 Tax=Sessilibacter corallicola TaxID=2904075 RepID=A0ABQ0AA91_9GAMM
MLPANSIRTMNIIHYAHYHSSGITLFQLKYPYWGDELPNYYQDHEEALQQFQMGVFEKAVLYVFWEFEVGTSI